MSISIGDAILYISGDDSKLKKSLKSAEAAYDQYEAKTGRAISKTTKMQAGDWFMMDAAGKKFGTTVGKVGDSMKAAGGQAVSMSQAFEWVGGSLGRYSKMLAMGGVVGGTIALGHAIYTVASQNEQLVSGLGRLVSKLTGPVKDAMNATVGFAGKVATGLADVADRAEFRAQETFAAKLEREAKERNKEAKQAEKTRNIGLIKRQGMAKDPRMDEVNRIARETAMAQTGMGIMGGLGMGGGGVSREEQAQMNMANQLGDQESWRQRRLGKRNLALEDLLRRKKGQLTGAFDQREAARKDTLEKIQQETGGDPNKTREFLAGFADWYQNQGRNGNAPRGSAAQVVNQYITISHANLALGEKQKAAYNLRRSTMPGVS